MGRNPLRILFLTLYPRTAASSRYRVEQFLPYLRAHGVTCTLASPLTEAEYAVLTGPDRRTRPMWYHLRETRRRIIQILAARRYDIVVVQKSIMTAYLAGMAALLRRCARCIVYDIDDAVHLAPPHPLRGVWRLAENRAQIEDLMGAASLVLAGNAWLAEAARQNGARTEVFPTVVDTDRFVPAKRAPERFCVGWIGNPSTTAHLGEALPILAGLRNADVRLVGADSSRLGPLPEAARPWTLETEVSEIQGFSVGIMPLPDTEWARGKCALKALQYMACGVPAAVSPVGAARDMIEHLRNGMVANSSTEWAAALDALRDPSLRRELGEAGRATVEARYALNRAAPRLLELLESAAR